MKKYIEHEIKVKFLDEYYAKNTEWTWFIEYVEENFETADIHSWNAFSDRHRHLQDVYSFFMKILEVSEQDICSENVVVKDIFYVAQFGVGKNNVDTTIQAVKSNYGKLLLLIVWITKLENLSNNTDYLFDRRFLVQKNVWQIMKMDSLVLYKDELFEYCNKINVEGFPIIREIFYANLNRTFFECRIEFLNENEDKLVSADAFNYQIIVKEDGLTWQESYLLDMVETKIEDKAITPLMSGSGGRVPDDSQWSLDVIDKMKRYFSNEVADFVLDTVQYVIYNNVPSENIVLKHCTLLSEWIQKHPEGYEFFCSSYEVISALFRDNALKGYGSNINYVEMIKQFGCVNDIDVLKKCLADGIPLSKEQRKEIKEAIVLEYKEIYGISDIGHLMLYLEKREIAKHINEEFFYKLAECFRSCVKGSYDLHVTSLFYEYMLFLLELKNVNQDISKRCIEVEIISIQQLWQKEYYEKACESLHSYSYEMKISTAEIKKYNESVLENPFVMSYRCMMTKESEMCEVMKLTSEMPIVHMVSHIHLDKVFPIKEGGSINYSRHEVDELISDIVKRILEKYGYRMLNILNVDVYVKAIHQRYRQNAMTYVSMFHSEKKLYKLISEQAQYKMLPFPTQIGVGHVSQLFPLLEMKIRELAYLLGIVPFKEDVKEFMKYKDPSTLLRIMLKDAYEITDSFERVSDLLFVYNFMYNGTSFNIRNELVHGREYIEEDGLKFAFKTTLLSIYMIDFRIRCIHEQLQAYKEVEE